MPKKKKKIYKSRKSFFFNNFKMMKIVSTNKNLLTNIAKFSHFDDIMSFKQSKKTIGFKLNVKSNEKMNDILLYQFMNMFRTEEDYEVYDNNKDKYINLKINFEEKMKNLTTIKDKMTILDANIGKSLDFIYHYQIYLPDLRKNNRFLEYNNSSIFMDKLYDYKRCKKWEKNYYGKQITDEYMSDITGNKKIKPLRERQYYEQLLINLREFSTEIKGNELYKKILNELIVEYNYNDIIKIFEGLSNEQLKSINSMVLFVMINTAYFKLYLINAFSSIVRFKDNYKIEKFLKEFIKQHNKILNVILFLNNSFNNVNLIVKYSNKYINKDLHKKNKKFSLMHLYLKMYKDKVYNKLIDTVLNKLDVYLEQQGIHIFEIKNDKNDDMFIEESDMDYNDYSYSFDNEDINGENEEAKTIKEITESLGNCILDMELDENNANSINHSEINLGEKYAKYEDILMENIGSILDTNLKKNNNGLDIFDRIKFLFEADKCSKRINSKNLKVINRTKRKLMGKVTRIFANYTKDKFDVSNKFYIYDEHKEDYSDFSEESEIKIKAMANDEINKIRNLLIKQHENIEGIEKIVDSYIKDNGDNTIVLAKRLIYFFSKETQFYADNDKRIQYLVNNDDEL